MPGSIFDADSGSVFDAYLHNLPIGDEITIRVIETDQPDEPLPPHSGGPGIIAIKSSGETE